MTTAAATAKITTAWTRSKADETAVADGCYFDLAAADRVRIFFSKFLRHSKGEFAGKPFELLDWQWQDVIAPVFGWKRADGTRRYRRFSVWIAKKNGKSTLAAGLVLYDLVADGEAGAEVYGAAADRQQARIIYDECKAMVEQSPLRAKLRTIDTSSRILYPDKRSMYRVLSAEAGTTGHGYNAHAVIVDELHVVDRKTYDTLRYAMAARRQPLFGEISTAGNDKTSLGYERYNYAKKLLNDEIQDSEQFAYIAEADSNDLWEDEAQWFKANPSLGVTIKLESFRGDFREAKNSSPAVQANFKQLRLNLWQDSINAYLDMARWDACGVEPVDSFALLGRECYAGLDLANTLDCASLVLVFPDDAEPVSGPVIEPAADTTDAGVIPAEKPLPPGTFTLLPFFWVPEFADRERERKNLPTYRNWIKLGLMDQTEGDEIDHKAILAKLLELAEMFKIVKVAYDPFNAAQFAQQMAEAGLDVVKFPQSIENFNEPTTTLSRLIKAGKVRHGGNPVLRWMAGNMSVHTNGLGNVMPARKKSTDKIDGMVAAIQGLAEALLRPGFADPTIDFV